MDASDASFDDASSEGSDTTLGDFDLGEIDSSALVDPTTPEDEGQDEEVEMGEEEEEEASGVIIVDPVEIPISREYHSRMRNAPVVVATIEEFVLSVVQAFSAGTAPVVIVQSRLCTWENGAPTPLLSRVSFARTRSRCHFALLIHYLGKLHEIAQKKEICTRREFFYRSARIFGKQMVVDMLTREASFVLRIPRAALPLVATAKGLVAGDLVFMDNQGTIINCKEAQGSVLIPSDIEGMIVLQSAARFVLVIEKDATFQHLIAEKFLEQWGPLIMITGKGYPDYATRRFLRIVWDYLQIPVLGLADADPCGAHILSIFKCGSGAMACDVDVLAVPSLCWLGFLPADVEHLKLPETALMPLTDKDIQVARSLLHGPLQHMPSWKLQIKKQLDLGCKAELEGLSSLSPNFLGLKYLPFKLKHQDWLV